MQGDSQKSVEFLKLFHPSKYWTLTSIDPDKKAIQTQSFSPDQEQEALDWISRFNGVRNVYFSVNPTIEKVSKKAEREDIASVDYLHVDLDPRAGEDIDEEQRRIANLLQSEGSLPKPTFIVFSGGGYQGFWKLQEPIPINGDVSKAEDAKRYNQQIEMILGGDNTHDVSRIMRLPYTINIPDSKKLKKGRQRALATVVAHDPANVYPISKFAQAPEVQTADDGGFIAHSVNISGNIQRLASVDDLPETLPGRIKVMIVQGMDPDEPNKYGSRSEILFSVVVALVRAGVDDTTIYSVITDPDFGISQSVLDKKNSKKYALRQIERAKEEAIHPELRRLNEKHAVIGDMGGKCRIISEVLDPAMKRTRISRQSFEDFRNRYGHIQVELGSDPNGKPIRKKLGHWWLENPLHRHFETICFAPGQEIDGSYNLWKGFGCEARPGDCSLFIAHLRDNICSGNLEHFNYLMGWMARAVQKPDSPGEVAVVMRGRMGTGKGLFAREFGSLFGRHFLQVSDPKHLVGSFNAHLRDCVVLFGDEAFFAGDKKHESVLKTLVTEPLITFEAKGVDAEAGPNFTHIILASNSNWIVPAGPDERRYFVLDVGSNKMQNADYFRAIMDQWNSGGREAFLYQLLTMDLSSFEVRSVPKTEALREQKLLSLDPEEEWWFTKLNEGRLMSSHAKWEGTVEKEELFSDFYMYMQKLGSYRRATKTALNKFLERVCPPSYPQIRQRWVEKKVMDNGGFEVEEKTRPYFYDFPELSRVRDSWNLRFGYFGDWPEQDEENPALPLKPEEDSPF